MLNDLSHRHALRQATNAIDKVNAAIAAAGGLGKSAITGALNALPKWMRTWYFEIEAAGTLGVAGAGAGASRSVWYDRRDGIRGTGTTTLASDSIGLDAGISAGIGFISGGATDMLGYFSATGVSVWIYC